jgi:hypothetical protein
MDCLTLDTLRRQFEDVAAAVGEGLSKANPHVVALAAKWDKSDLVPGLSDLDFRVICDDSTTVEDWVEIDYCTGRLHLEMVRSHPQWNRINEHTAGAGMTISEALGRPFNTPEYAHWSLWWGRPEWLDRLKAQEAMRQFSADDEYYHLSKFLSYYSPYNHEIDPPINLGRFEAKYPLHSRCWHYFAPPILSAASLLARKNFSGKRAGLTWLRDNGYVAEQVDAVFRQIEAHYETPEQTDAGRLQAFEDFLFSAFRELLPLAVGAIKHLDIDRSTQPTDLKIQLASIASDPLVTLIENVRYARIRAGRYYFYTNAPHHFDSKPLMYWELPWLRRLCGPILGSFGTLVGDETLSPKQCFARLGLSVNCIEERAIQHALDLAKRTRGDKAVPHLLAEAAELFPHYYRLIECALACVLAQMPAIRQTAIDSSHAIPSPVTVPHAAPHHHSKRALVS